MLQNLLAKLPHFARDRSGNVAMIFGLSIIPVVGLAGGAVDVHRAARDMAGLQSAFDAAAIAAARKAADGPAAVRQEAQNYLDANLAPRLKAYPINVEVSDGGRTVRITTDSATMQTAFLGVIGMKTLNIAARSTATSTTFETTVAKKPVTAQLDPEAGDYNRMYVYCYDDSRRNKPDRGRSQMTAIADNAGTTYSFNMPTCLPGETLSYRLYNVRNARTQPSRWDTAPSGTLVKGDTRDPWAGNAAYNYYSDTIAKNGVLTHQFENNIPILETAICDTLAQCKNRSQGGIIPTGKNRTPEQATLRCDPGKFLYLGWEDRPPGYGWSDSDYDDIRVIVECPSNTTTQTTVVRLVE